jgi:hypothetical protein
MVSSRDGGKELLAINQIATDHDKMAHPTRI